MTATASLLATTSASVLTKGMIVGAAAGTLPIADFLDLAPPSSADPLPAGGQAIADGGNDLPVTAHERPDDPDAEALAWLMPPGSVPFVDMTRDAPTTAPVTTLAVADGPIAQGVAPIPPATTTAPATDRDAAARNRPASDEPAMIGSLPTPRDATTAIPVQEPADRDAPAAASIGDDPLPRPDADMPVETGALPAAAPIATTVLAPIASIPATQAIPAAATTAAAEPPAAAASTVVSGAEPAGSVVEAAEIVVVASAAPAALPLARPVSEADASLRPAAPGKAPEPTVPDMAVAAPTGARSVAAPPPLAAAAVVASAAVTTAARTFAEAIHRSLSDDAHDPATLAPASAPALPHIAAPVVAGAQGGAIDMRQHAWPEAMIAQIERLRDMADANDTSIRLVPDALGAIDVSLKRDGDAVQVTLHAEQAQTRAMIVEAQPRLHDMAEQRGLKLQTSTGGSGNAPPQQQQQQQARQQQPAAPPPAFTRQQRADAPDDARLA